MVTPKGSERSATNVGRKSHPPWATLAWALPAFAALLARMRAIDLAYHVRAGELTLRTRDLVLIDPFTFTRAGDPWLNQQWAAQLIFASAHRVLGWAGVGIDICGCAWIGLLVPVSSCRRAEAAPRTAALLTLLGFLVASGSLAARPQALAVPLFTGTWLLLARRDRWTWLVPILALIWANVHGSFVLAPLLVVFALGDDLIERRPAARTLLLVLATVVATLVTPFGPSVWSYAVEISTSETIRNGVAEWRPPSPLSISGAPFWLSGVIVLVTAVRKRRAVRSIDIARLHRLLRPRRACAPGHSVVGARGAPRHISLVPDNGARATAIEESVGRDPLRVIAAAFVLALLPIALFLRRGVDPVTGTTQRLAADAPEVLVDATRSALPLGSRLLVYQPFASWFEFSLPEDRVMVDSRIELFPDTVWDDYDRVITAGDGWERILDDIGSRASSCRLEPC